jgi:hypothetical protein
VEQITFKEAEYESVGGVGDDGYSSYWRRDPEAGGYDFWYINVEIW